MNSYIIELGLYGVMQGRSLGLMETQDTRWDG